MMELKITLAILLQNYHFTLVPNQRIDRVGMTGSLPKHGIKMRIEERGPGSWKREAYWDEYMLSIKNHCDQPVTLSSSMLIDFQDNQVMSGSDPWELQEQSKEWIKGYDSGTTGVVLKVGAASLLP